MRTELTAALFDRARLLANSGGDEDLLREVVGVFLREAPRLRREIESVLERADAGGLERAAHALKGMMSLVSGEEAVAPVCALEERAHAGDLERSRALCWKVDAALGRLCAELEGEVGCRP